MTSTTTTPGRRHAALRQMLEDRRRQTLNEVHGHLRQHLRADGPKTVLDDYEHSEAHVQGDIAVALMQMGAETLNRIGEALARLDAGRYGLCLECDGEIAERRLRALPFAVRCTACEERCEQDHARERRFAMHHDGPALFGRLAGYGSRLSSTG